VPTPIPAHVEDVGGLKAGARERVDDDRDVPGDPIVDVPAEQVWQLGGDLPGDLLGDVGSGYQPQGHGVGMPG
jgi:hypothetical protein